MKNMANLKDSGDRREFDTGAVRDMAEGKGRMDLIPWDVALNIRDCMMRHYSKHKIEIPINDVLDRFATIEYLLNGGTKLILPENFEIAAAAWIMFEYYYYGAETSGTTIDADGHITKECIDRIWASAMMDLAKHFEDGAKKYGDNNWRKGIPTWCYFDSASRHLMKFILGWDDEPHDRAVLWNLMCGAWTSRHLVDKEDTADFEKNVTQAEKDVLINAATKGSTNACNAGSDARFMDSQKSRREC